jgi:hypothetical protein
MTKEEMAKKFSLALKEEIGIDNLKKVIKLNAEEKDIRICHSHDFTDANQVMLDSIDPNMTLFKNLEDQWDKIEEIWTMADLNNFYI